MIRIGQLNIKYTQDYVESVFKERNCKLLDVYRNANTPMKYICSCGHENLLNFDKFRKQKHGCRYCTKIGGYTHEEVKEYFEKHGCQLLSKYAGVKGKLDYICSCGNIAAITFDNFKNKNGRCYKCGLKKLAEINRHNIEFVKQTFIDNNCIPLFESYVNDRQLLKYQCSCGNISHIRFLDFQYGKKCNNCRVERILKSMYQNGTQKASLQQRYLQEIIGGVINYPVGNSSLDIAFPEDNIYVEYDGSGHDLAIKLGDKTQKEFYEKEKRRNYALQRRGWKSIRIISSKDNLPNNEGVMQIFNDGINILKTHSWVVFDIDNSKVKYNNLIEYYDYGELKRIRRD